MGTCRQAVSRIWGLRAQPLAVALLISGCSADEHASTGTLIDAAESSPSSATDRPASERNIAQKRVESGVYRGLAIGMSREQVKGALMAMKILSVEAQSANRLRASAPSELYLLQNVRGIRLLPGSVVVRFDGERVSRVWVSQLPAFDRWRQRLQGARTRSDAFAIFAEILETMPGQIVEDIDQVRRLYFLRMTDADVAFMNDTGEWRGSVREESGWTYLRLTFDQAGGLSAIDVMTSPTELL